MAETHENNTGKKSSKKLIIIIVLAVLLLGGVGAGVYFYFFKKPAEVEHTKGKSGKEKHEVVAEPKHEESHEASHESGHDEKAEPDVYYELPSALIVDFPVGSSVKVIKISVTILVKGEAAAAALKKNEPMVRNNLLMVISALGAEKAKTVEGKQALQASILSEVGKVLEKMAGKNTAKDVYFTEFVMQ